MPRDLTDRTIYLPPSLFENNTIEIYKDVLTDMGYGYMIAPNNSLKLIAPWRNCYGIIPPTIIVESTFLKRLRDIDPLLETDNLKRALELAKKVHKTQLRDNSRDYYIEHILPVALYYIVSHDLLDHEYSGDFLISALLHDSIEDSDGAVIAYESTRIDDEQVSIEQMFGNRVAMFVDSLTKPKIADRDLKMKTYIEKINSYEETIIIKCIDRLLNLSCDVENIQDRNSMKTNRYLEETYAYFLPLFKKVDSYFLEILEIITQAVKKANNKTSS